MAAEKTASGDRTQRSITIWAAISTVLLAGVLSGVYLLSLGLGGSDPVEKAGPFGFGDGILALSVAVFPGLIGTLIAFFVASRVEKLGLSASDKIAADVEQRLMNSVALPQFENKLDLGISTLSTTAKPGL